MLCLTSLCRPLSLSLQLSLSLDRTLIISFTISLTVCPSRFPTKARNNCEEGYLHAIHRSVTCPRDSRTRDLQVCLTLSLLSHFLFLHFFHSLSLTQTHIYIHTHSPALYLPCSLLVTLSNNISFSLSYIYSNRLSHNHSHMQSISL